MKKNTFLSIFKSWLFKFCRNNLSNVILYVINYVVIYTFDYKQSIIISSITFCSFSFLESKFWKYDFFTVKLQSSVNVKG